MLYNRENRNILFFYRKINRITKKGINMDKFVVIKVMNEAMIRLRRSKNEDCEKNEKIKKFLDDEALFFKIKKETAIRILISVGVKTEKLEETYQKLIEKDVYENLIRKGKINSNDNKLIVKYN